MKTKKELQDLSDYMNGYADATQNPKLQKIAEALKEMVWSTCDQGITGCYIKDCTSDHD